MRMINEIIIHSTATPRGMNVSAKNIDLWHKNAGYESIGYHYVVKLSGVIEKGRPDDQVGAHTARHNSTTLGICYVGGLGTDGKPKDTRTQAQKLALVALIKELLKKYPSITKITSHSDYCKTACPSFDATNEYRGLLL